MKKEYEALSLYDYTLPEEYIALYPPEIRGDSRLLVLNRKNGTIQHTHFSAIFSFLPSPVLFVSNNSKVLPARLCTMRSSGGAIELLLLSPIPLLDISIDGDMQTCTATVLIKGSKRCKVGETLHFIYTTPHATTLMCTIIEKMDYGKCIVNFMWAKGQSLEDIFATHGHIPLPPYIKRGNTSEDITRYQSIFAHDDKCGSVAAPTASLHCSESFMKKMHEHGSSMAHITLYVGYGTFSPIRTENIYEHSLHEEYIEITQDNAEKIQTAQKQGIPIIAIGTTVTRTLESVIQKYGRIQATHMNTSIYITPQHTFRCVDAMITNFHLPQSSLLVLVSSFASREQILHAYAEAIAQKYRFFSYGDAMIIL